MDNPAKRGAKSEAEVLEEAKRKKEILDKVVQSSLPTKTILKEMGISRSTYYSWLKRYEEEGMEGLMDSRSLVKSDDKGEELTAPEEKAEVQAVEAAAGEKVEPAEVPEAAPEMAADAEAPVLEAREESVERGQEMAEAVAEATGPEEARREEKIEFGGGGRKRGMGAYAVIAGILLVIGLLLSISSSNYNTYRLSKSGDTLTLWKGKFAPRGLTRVESFKPVAVGDNDVSALTGRSFVGKEAVYKAIIAFLVDQVDTEAKRGNNADMGKINRLLDQAEGIAGSGMQGEPTLADVRFRLAQRRVAIAEKELREAYQKSLPIYEEALARGLGDASVLGPKVEAMRQALGLGAPEGPVAKEGKKTTEAVAAPEGAPAAPQAKAKEEAAAAKTGQTPTTKP